MSAHRGSLDELDQRYRNTQVSSWSDAQARSRRSVGRRSRETGCPSSALRTRCAVRGTPIRRLSHQSGVSPAPSAPTMMIAAATLLIGVELRVRFGDRYLAPA